MNNTLIARLLMTMLGKRLAYRLGRALYQQARGDILNSMSVNGELVVQACVLDAWRKSYIKAEKLIVFDVGANIGDWSYALLDNVLKTHDLHALGLYLFEPSPGTAKTLKSRLSKFDGPLYFEPSVLSSEAGTCQFYINSNTDDAGTNSVYQQDFEAVPVNVQKTTVSQFCEERKIDTIHLLKCDTEGHDMEVIRGALPLLREGRIAVFQFEYNYRWIYARNFLRDVFTLIETLPYKLAKLQSDHVLIIAEWHFELEKFFEGNYVLIHVDALAWFPTKNISMDRFNTMCLDAD